jgi:cell division protein FtsW
VSSVFGNIKFKGDKIIWAIVILLSLFSVMVVYSSAGWDKLINHIPKLSLGLFAMYIVHLIPFKYFSKLGQLGYFTSLLLLLLVPFIGITLNGASRWLGVGGFQFQPSDVAKLVVILFMARQISVNRDNLDGFKEFVWYVLAPLVIVCLLILPNNFSTSALVFINGMVVMFVGKIRLQFIAKVLGIALVGVFVIYGAAKYTPIGTRIMPRSATWVSRIDNFVTGGDDQQMDKDYQQTQALVAIQNGGLYGVGPGKSTQRSILPYSYSDFIYAIILEEYGLIGGVAAILFYLILLFRAVRISLKSESVFGSLVAISLMFSLVFQAFTNMLVSVEIMPVTGQTLPLISMGGTSIVFSCIAIGIVLSISRDSIEGEYEKA